MELRSGEAIYPGMPWGGFGRMEEDDEEWRSSVESEDDEQLSLLWNWVGRGGGLGAGALPRVKWHNWATS